MFEGIEIGTKNMELTIFPMILFIAADSFRQYRRLTSGLFSFINNMKAFSGFLIFVTVAAGKENGQPTSARIGHMQKIVQSRCSLSYPWKNACMANGTK